MQGDKTHQLMKRLQDNRSSLNIARLPTKTREDFKALAKEEFCDDYGMALREVLNFYFEHHAMKVLFFQNIDAKLDHIINFQESQSKPEEQFETKKMLAGREFKIKKKEVKQHE